MQEKHFIIKTVEKIQSGKNYTDIQTQLYIQYRRTIDMGITAKELAARLNLSATAVSMALNGKPGVSTETRALVIREAEKAGYDFSRLSMKKNVTGDVVHYLPCPQRNFKLYSNFFRAHQKVLNRGMP